MIIPVSYLPVNDFNSTGPDWVIRNRLYRYLHSISGIRTVFFDPENPDAIGIVWRSEYDIHPGIPEENIHEVRDNILTNMRTWSYEDIFGREMPPPRNSYTTFSTPIRKSNNYSVSLRGLYMNALPKNAVNAITMEPIQEGNNMVNFHGEANLGRYYTKNTYNALVSPKHNPFSRQSIIPSNVIPYKAKIKGGKYKTFRKKRSMRKRYTNRR